MKKKEATALLSRINNFLKQGDLGAVFDDMYDTFDEMIDAREFQKCDDILRAVEVEMYPLNVLLGFLTITLRARDNLPERHELYKRIYAHLVREHAQFVLYGLE